MKIDTNLYKIRTWKNLLNLHWILNPGIAINELLLGQRIPKLTLIAHEQKPLAERTYIPCPHCETIHPAAKWSPQNKTAFRNWFGLYCDNCGGIIPCLRNLTSAIILVATFPIWIWFVKSMKKNWLVSQKERFSKPMQFTIPGYNWISQGLSWGFFMFVVMELFINPLADGGGYHAIKILAGLVFWSMAGLLFGYLNKKALILLSKSSPHQAKQTTR